MKSDEIASSGDGAESSATPGASPTIPHSMLPGIAGSVDLSGGAQPPVPNQLAIQPQTSTPHAFDPELPVADEGERVRAVAGVGKQGQSLNDERGVGAMIVQPARTLFAVRQRLVFETLIPKFMDLYKATAGHFPKSHEEFMTKIIKANYVKLPELPAGQTYVYDPELGELMVQKPSR
jgi:hypothetical protein